MYLIPVPFSLPRNEAPAPQLPPCPEPRSLAVGSSSNIIYTPLPPLDLTTLGRLTPPQAKPKTITVETNACDEFFSTSPR